jgi:SAM-dependent methyltransferase
MIIAKNLVHNSWFMVRARLGCLSTIHGATHLSFGPEESVRYIEKVFSEYLSYGDLRPAELEGKRVLEIGPGDNLGVALKFVALGAKVACLDRFKPYRDEERERLIYCRLREALCAQGRKRFDAAVELGSGIRLDTESLKPIYGIGIEHADQVFAPASFDFIISRAVLTEISDPDRAFQMMNRLLSPGGYSIHKVAPLNDYRMFRQYGYHPLEFLTIPNCIYRRMVSNSGKPNRRLLSYYKSRFNPAEYEVRFYPTALLGSDESAESDTARREDTRTRALCLLHELRPRLPRHYRDLPEEDLLVEDFFIVARKLRS